MIPQLSDLRWHIRAMNAGPFWIAIDLFVANHETFDGWAESPSLLADSLARHLGIDAVRLLGVELERPPSSA